MAAGESSFFVAQPPAWKAVFAEASATIDDSQRAAGPRQRQDRVTVIKSSQRDVQTEDEAARDGWGGDDEASGSGWGGGDEVSGSGWGGDDEVSGSGDNPPGIDW